MKSTSLEHKKPRDQGAKEPRDQPERARGADYCGVPGEAEVSK